MCPKLIELVSWNGPTVHVWCFMLARASTKTFVSRIDIRQPSSKNSEKIFVSRKIRQQCHSLAEVSLYKEMIAVCFEIHTQHVHVLCFRLRVMCFIVMFCEIVRLYLSVLLLVECVSFVLLSIVLSREVLVDLCFLCDKVAVFGESAKRDELNIVKTLKNSLLSDFWKQ